MERATLTGKVSLRSHPYPLWSNLSPDAIWDFANNELIVSGPNGTAGIFATYPSGHLDMVNGFFDQVWGWGTRHIGLFMS